MSKAKVINASISLVAVFSLLFSFASTSQAASISGTACSKAGDQYLGRVVAGLNCRDPAFAVLPPYFDFSSCTNPEEAEKEVDNLILSHLVCGNEVNPRLFLIFCMLFTFFGIIQNF